MGVKDSTIDIIRDWLESNKRAMSPLVDDLSANHLTADETATVGETKVLNGGGDLGTAIEAALGDGYSDLVITQPTDDSWVLEDQVTIDPTAYPGGVSIDARRTRIDVESGDWSIVFDSGGDLNTQIDGRTATITGGLWNGASAPNPTGWLQVKDCFRATVEPHLVEAYTNDTNDCVGVSFENHDVWTESWDISGYIDNVDIGVDFVPASVTGGSGTDSFQQGYSSNLIIDNVQEIGVRWRGGIAYCSIDNLTTFLAGDGAVGNLFDASFAETVFTAPKMEDIGADGTIGIETASEYGNDPMLIEPSFVNIDTSVSLGSSDHDLWENRAGTFDVGYGEVNDTGFMSTTFDLADDEAGTTTHGNVKFIIVLGDAGDPDSGIFHSGFNKLSTVSADGMTNEGSTTLGGTDGTDGTLNIAKDGNDLYIENRTGSAGSFTVLELQA